MSAAMSTWADPGLAPACARLAPYARASFERAAALAARLHADELSPEHWLAALLSDEDCAATRAVLHAFADPETIGIEVLALCAGIMVVGSERTLPFSVLGVEALHAARARAVAGGHPRVETAMLFLAAVERLAPELRTRLERLPDARLELRPEAAPPGEPVAASGPLFRHFSGDALRALGASCRSAAGLQRDAIGPAHMLIGALEVDAALRESTHLVATRVRMVAGGLDVDATPLPARRLPGDDRLRALLAALPERAETLDVMTELFVHGSEELGALLRRQKVTSALVERCRGVYRDPDPDEGADAGARPGAE